MAKPGSEEGVIVKSILDWLSLEQKTGARLWFKRVFTGPVLHTGVRGKNPMKGTPDILLCLNGYFAGWEVKDAKGKPSSDQERELGDIQASGGQAVIIRSLDEAMDAYEQLEGKDS